MAPDNGCPSRSAIIQTEAPAMDLSTATRLALGLDMQALVHSLRESLDNGMPTSEVASLAQELGIHPLSLAALPGKGTEKARRDQNRAAARALGMREPWISQIRAHGLRIRDAQIDELPPGLVLSTLHLIRLPNLTRLPEGLRVANLRIEQCHRLQILPSLPGLESLDLLDNHGLRELPRSPIALTLRISGCPRLETLPGIVVPVVDLKGCTGLSRVDPALQCLSLDLDDLRMLRSPLPRSVAEGEALLSFTHYQGLEPIPGECPGPLPGSGDITGPRPA